jgi:predicted  nucleic acid-binding Zn-ribbon protein
MTDCREQLNDLTFRANVILEEDLEALKRMPERLRIERYNEVKSDEKEFQWEYRKKCGDFLGAAEQERIRGELRLARLLIAASFYAESSVPAPIQEDFIEAELRAVVEFNRYKQFDALDQEQIEQQIRRMEGEVYELVQEYTSTQIANMDELINNPDVQQDVIERLTKRYEDRRERIRQGFFVYVETHGLEHMVESIEAAIEAVSHSTADREQIQAAVEEELSDLGSTLDINFEQQQRQIERELNHVEQQLATGSVDANAISQKLSDLDPAEDDVLEAIDSSISELQELQSQLEGRIGDLEAAKQTARESDRQEIGEQAADVVNSELERLREQRDDLQREIDRLRRKREEIEASREKLSERHQSLTSEAEKATEAASNVGISGSDVVTSSTARLFEMDYIGRFQTTIHETEQIQLPDETCRVPDGYWEDRSERRTETARMENLLRENGREDDDIDSHPVNPTARYEIIKSTFLGREATQMIIEATVYSHLPAHARNHFDSNPATLDDLLGFVNEAVAEANDGEIPYLMGIASPTGWTDEVRDLVVDDEVSRTRYSRYVSVCLIDLRTGELFYDDSDTTITDNISLFNRAVQSEVVEDCVSMLHSDYVTEPGRETVIADEVAEKTDYDQNVIKQSFERIESRGDGEQFYIDEYDLALDVGLDNYS